MIRALLLASAALVAAPAAAQVWTVGNQGADWSVPSSKPTGAAPADAFEPPVIALPDGVVESEWLVTVPDQLTNDRASGLGFVKPTNPATGEKKLRFTCEPSTVKIKDNIKGPGIKKFGHPHQGVGLIDWDENTNYLTARANPKSSCQGGPLVATNYMEPAFLKQMPNGATVSVLPQGQAVYYVRGTQADPNDMTWLRAGTGLIFGADPTNFNDAARRAAYQAAGYFYPGGLYTPAGMKGYTCQNGAGFAATAKPAHAYVDAQGNVSTAFVRYLKGPNGEDPFNGCSGTVQAPAAITSTLLAPGCWDRTNLTAVGGRDHFWHEAVKKLDTTEVKVCPKTTSGVDYGLVPDVEIKNTYYTIGFTDYGSWWLDSDRMDPALTVTPGSANDPVTQGDPASLSPCRQVGPYFCAGETLHADWFYGHHRPVFDKAQRECLGISVRGIPPVDGPAECNFGIFSRFQQLTNTAPAGKEIWFGGCSVFTACNNNAVPSAPITQRYKPVPGYQEGTVTLKHQH
jgi:hypothetical protein